MSAIHYETPEMLDISLLEIADSSTFVIVYAYTEQYVFQSQSANPLNQSKTTDHCLQTQTEELWQVLPSLDVSTVYHEEGQMHCFVENNWMAT